MALDQLIDDGILEKIPNKGIFVKTTVSETGTKFPPTSCLFPMGNFFSGKRPELIRFGTEDPEGFGWEQIIDEFEQSVDGRVKVMLHPSIPYGNTESTSPECDLFFGTLRNICAGKIDLENHPHFPADWHNRKPWLPDLKKKLTDKLKAYFEFEQTGPRAIPAGFIFPFQLVNLEVAKSLGITPPEPMCPLEKFDNWLTEISETRTSIPLFPFVQNPLHHFCRLNRSLLPENVGEGLNLNHPVCIELLQLQKKYFKDYFLTKPEIMLPAVFEALYAGNFLSLEIFTSAFCALKDRFNETSRYNGINNFFAHSSGMTQLMFRYLFFGKNCANYEASLRFAEFITSYQGQRLAATHKIMLPCYHDKSNISIFCEGIPLSEETVQREIDNADDFFSSPYFNFRFEEEVLNPTLRGYFAEQISLKETIQIIEKSDFVKNAAKKSRQA
jgi:hypothetical protein